MQTFSQLCNFDFNANLIELHSAPWTILDAPRFPYRGLLIGRLVYILLYLKWQDNPPSPSIGSRLGFDPNMEVEQIRYGKKRIMVMELMVARYY
jgi:hypothetical protein